MNFPANILSSCLAWSTLAWGVEFNGITIPDLSHGVGVEVQVRHDPASAIFDYDYTLSNPPGNSGQFRHFDLDVSNPEGSVDFSGEGLGPDVRFTRKSVERMIRETGVRVIALAAQSPPRWVGDIGLGKRLGWGCAGEPFRIKPGQKLGGFKFRTRVPPGISTFRAEPFFVEDGLPALDDISEEEELRIYGPDPVATITRLQDQTASTGTTVSPRPPSSLDPADLIARLISFKHRSADLGWLRGEEFIRQLDRKLDQAKEALLRGKPFKARKKLMQFVHRLEQQRQEQQKRQREASEKDRQEREEHAREDKRFLHDNAFFLLMPNAEFILSKLPPRPKDDQDKDDEDEDESLPGSPSRTPSRQPSGLSHPHTAAADPSFRLVAIYSFPNPARRSEKPTIRVQVGLADSVDIKIYDTLGRLVHSASVAVARVIDDAAGPQYAYDYLWDTTGVGSGVYSCAVTAHKAGQADIRKTDKLAIIK